MQSGNDERGVTIIEAIIALAIVTSGVVGLVGLARQTTDGVARARRHLVAAALAESGLAERLAAPMLPTSVGCLERDTGGCVEPLDGHGRPHGSDEAFIRRWRVTAVSGGVAPVWSMTVCVVPIEQRRHEIATPGACVSRLVGEVQP